jgi:hypothetical protein
MNLANRQNPFKNVPSLGPHTKPFLPQLQLKGCPRELIYGQTAYFTLTLSREIWNFLHKITGSTSMSTRKKILFYEHNDAFVTDKILGKYPLVGNHLDGQPSFLTTTIRDSVEAALQIPQTSGTVNNLLGEVVQWKIIKE